jgi:mannose-6-phosphate isomerase
MEGRMLHIEKSLAVVNPTITGQAIPCPPLQDGDCQMLCQSQYFTLEILSATTRAITCDTRGESFHALTVTAGSARLIAGNETCTLGQFESLVIPAATGAYRLEPLQEFRALKSGL